MLGSEGGDVVAEVCPARLAEQIVRASHVGRLGLESGDFFPGGFDPLQETVRLGVTRKVNDTTMLSIILHDCRWW